MKSQLKKGVSDIDQSLETALLVLSQDTKQGGRKKVIIFNLPLTVENIYLHYYSAFSNIVCGFVRNSMFTKINNPILFGKYIRHGCRPLQSEGNIIRRS